MSFTQFTFTIPGDPKGYYAQAGRLKWKMSKQQRARAEKYRKWQGDVALCYLAGRRWCTALIPALPLEATKDRPLRIETVSYFRNGRHPDPENVHKGIVDALFRWSLGGDRHVGGTFRPPLYDKDNPRVEVLVRWET